MKMEKETKTKYYDKEKTKKRLERNFVNNRLHGIACGWYESGQLKYEYKYIDGVQEGVCKGWDKNGQLKYEYNYKKGKRV